MVKALILTSPTTSKNISQASIFYIAELLRKDNIKFDILDLSGMIDYYDPPVKMYENQKELWQSPLIFNESWIDNYIPECKDGYDYIYTSAMFSMDIIFQGRYVKKCKDTNPNIKAKIGGPAIKNLTIHQLKVISSIFDDMFMGDLSPPPNYDLNQYRLKEFITIATGTGCDWGNCVFCNSGKERYSLRSFDEIVEEFLCISNISDSEIMLSSDSISIAEINDLSLRLSNIKNTRKYNLMMRADKKIDKIFSENLKMSGCSDVFIGGEILDDGGLLLINKGTTVETIISVVKSLSNSGICVQLGLILFLPCIKESQLENQLRNLEKILPYMSCKEPSIVGSLKFGLDLETLSVLYNSDFYNRSGRYGIDLYPKKNPIFSTWCYGLSPDIPWGFKDDTNYFMWKKHIDSLREILDGYVNEEYWWHVNYIEENWK